jgi:HEPN domain-containing protein
MPRNRVQVGSPQEWLLRAKSNLALASLSGSEEIYLEDLCFEAQQAAEKSIKSVLLKNNIPFRYIHDLAELLTLVEQNGINLTEDVRNAASLTDYSVEARYPGPFEPVTEEEYREALRLAETVVAWAVSLVTP